MPQPKPQREPAECGQGSKVHELKPDEKMARITLSENSARLDCLVFLCPFWVTVPHASKAVMEAELKEFYKSHRRLRHREYVGRTLFDYVLGEDVPRIVQKVCEPPCP